MLATRMARLTRVVRALSQPESAPVYSRWTCVSGRSDSKHRARVSLCIFPCEMVWARLRTARELCRPRRRPASRVAVMSRFSSRPAPPLLAVWAFVPSQWPASATPLRRACQFISRCSVVRAVRFPSLPVAESWRKDALMPSPFVCRSMSTPNVWSVVLPPSLRLVLETVGRHVSGEVGVFKLPDQAVGEVLLGPALGVADRVHFGGKGQALGALHAQLEVVRGGRQCAVTPRRLASRSACSAPPRSSRPRPKEWPSESACSVVLRWETLLLVFFKRGAKAAACVGVGQPEAEVFLTAQPFQPPRRVGRQA